MKVNANSKYIVSSESTACQYIDQTTSRRL